MGLRLIRDLPGAPGCLATVAHDACASARDTSFGVSGPRDFAVRLSSFVRMRDARCDETRPSHPTQRFVTFAKAPLDRAGWGNKIMNSEKKKQEYSPRRDWTGQISLRSRGNFAFLSTREESRPKRSTAAHERISPEASVLRGGAGRRHWGAEATKQSDSGRQTVAEADLCK